MLSVLRNQACALIVSWSRLALVAWLLAATPGMGQVLPTARLSNIYPQGGKPGGMVDVSILGVDLEDANGLLFTHAGITAVQKTVDPGPFQTGPQPVPNQFQVTIAGDVPPGLYEVRAVGKYGVTNPRMFMVDPRPELAETEGNNDVKQAQEIPLGTTVYGKINGGADLDFFKFTATQGQRVLIDCWAQRLDSRLDGTLVLLDANGRELAANRDMAGRDPLLDFTAPADGVYVVKLYDSTYAASDDYHYRLVVGAGPHIDFVFPPSGLPGTTGRFTLFGRNLPGGTPAEGVMVAGRILERLDVDIPLPADPSPELAGYGARVSPESAGVDQIGFRLPGPQGPSNPVLIGLATGPVVAEQEPNDLPAAATKVTLPCEFVGQFQKPRDRDWLAFEGVAGTTYWAEITSQRHGLPTDPHILVQRIQVNDKGEETSSDLVEGDDLGVNLGGLSFNTTTEDTSIAFSIPADGLYRILVQNQFQSGDPRHVYRLSLRAATPDFRLAVVPQYPVAPGAVMGMTWSPLLRRGGTEVLNVMAWRRDGFNGEIVLSIEGLPAGVTCPSVTLGAGQTSGGLVLSAAEDAAAWVGTIKVVGKAKIGEADVTRLARTGSVIWDAPQAASAAARLTSGLALAVSGTETDQFFVDAGQNQVWEMSRAGTLTIPLKITRRAGFAGAVSLQTPLPPPNIPVPAVAINPDQAEVPLVFQLPPTLQPGTYSFYLTGTTQVAYSRNPEAAAVAAAYKAELDKIVTELTDASTKANEAKTVATTAAAEAAAKAKAATDAQAVAVQAFTDASAAAKAAADLATAAKTALDNDANNQTLIDAKAAADKAAADTAAAAKVAEEAKLAADKAAEEAAALAKTAEEARVAAETAATETAAKLVQAQQAQAAATQAATNATNAANPQNINVFVPSTAVTIKVTEAPISVALTAPSAALKQGAQVEVPITITRLYNYNEQVTIAAMLPGGVAGLNIAQVVIPAGQNQVNLVIQAAADATVGSHALIVRTTIPFNGQQLQIDTPLPLAVEAP